MVKVDHLSWDEPFTSLDYNNLRKRRAKIMNGNDTNIIATHKFESLFPSESDDIYLFFINKKKRNLVKLNDILCLEKLPVEIREIVTKLFSELFSASPINLVVEGKNDVAMIKKAYEIIGKVCKINFISLNGVSKLKIFTDTLNYVSDFLGTKTRVVLDNDPEAKLAREQVADSEGIIKLTDDIFKKFPNVDSLDQVFTGPSSKSDKDKKIRNFLKKTNYTEEDIETCRFICNTIDDSFK